MPDSYQATFVVYDADHHHVVQSFTCGPVTSQCPYQDLRRLALASSGLDLDRFYLADSWSSLIDRDRAAALASSHPIYLLPAIVGPQSVEVFLVADEQATALGSVAIEYGWTDEQVSAALRGEFEIDSKEYYFRNSVGTFTPTDGRLLRALRGPRRRLVLQPKRSQADCQCRLL